MERYFIQRKRARNDQITEGDLRQNLFVLMTLLIAGGRLLRTSSNMISNREVLEILILENLRLIFCVGRI